MVRWYFSKALRNENMETAFFYVGGVGESLHPETARKPRLKKPIKIYHGFSFEPPP